MKWIIKYFLICIFLCGIYSTKAQNFSGVFQVADSLINQNAFREATIELERVWYLGEVSDVKTKALIRKAWCYKQLHQFSKISETLNRVFLINQPDSIVFIVRFERALAFYLNGESGKSLTELQLIPGSMTETDQVARKSFLLTLCQCELQMWNQAKQSAISYFKCIETDSVSLLKIEAQLEELFNSKNIPKVLSGQKAKTLSTFLPGGGQFYTGKVGEGLISLLLHAALLYFGIHQFAEGFYFTGYTAGFGLFQRIYTGNLQRVQDLVKEVNAKKRDKFLKELLAVLTEV